MGLGLGRMVSFAGSQRRNIAHLVRDNAAILEVRKPPRPGRPRTAHRGPTAQPYLQVTDELSKLSSVSSELRTFRRQQRAELVKAARRSSGGADSAGALATGMPADDYTHAPAAGSGGHGAEEGSAAGRNVSPTSPLFVSVAGACGRHPVGPARPSPSHTRAALPPGPAEQNSGGADLVDQAILASELARARHTAPHRSPAEAPE